MTIELPQRFTEQNYCFNWLRKLDEAHQVAQPKFFEHYGATSIRVEAHYSAIHGRSMYKPIIELWNLDLNLEIMTAALNSKYNPALF